MRDEERPAAEGPLSAAGDRRGPRPSAARSRRLAPKAKADGVLLRARPLLAAVAGVALGVACGQWLIGRLAGRLPPAQAQAAASVAAAGLMESPAPARVPAVAAVAQPSEAGGSAKPSDTERRKSEVRTGAAAEGARQPPVVVEAERRKEINRAPTASEMRREGATAGPVGRGAGGRRGGGRCVLSVSAGSVSLRAGGSAAVTAAVDELAGRGVFTASTSHWPDIAVFSDSAAGGRARYTVISVSRRPGTYSVTLKSPCGVKILPVTVR